MNLSSLSLNISGRKGEEVTRIYSIDECGMCKFCSSSFGSLHVFPPHAITVVAVWQATEITRLNVYVKMAFSENIARKICALS